MTAPLTITDADHPRRPLPAAAGAGPDVVIRAGRLEIGPGCTIGPGTVLAGDTVTLGAGVTIGRGCDLRAGRLSIGPRSEIGAGVTVLAAEAFEVGRAARISDQVRVVCRSLVAGTLLYLGHEATVGYGGTTESTATLRLGDRVALGPRTIVNANHPVDLGDDVGTGSDVTFWTHGYHFGHRLLDGYRATFAPIVLEPGVWLGYHCSVMPGVRVGAGTIVAAGAVVAADLPAGCLAAGVPAKVKSPLRPVPPEGAAALDAVRDVLAGWAGELAWKQVPVVADPGGSAWTVDPGATLGPAHRVRLVLAAAGPVTGRADLVEVVVALGYEAAHTGPEAAHTGPEAAYAGPHAALFLPRTGRLHGATSAVIEDLRDHLRRHALPCGDERCFTSITPEAFTRLRRMTAAGPPALQPAAGRPTPQPMERHP
ncbi:hypothetical protein ACFPIJ_58535 [Dactylosporangium cerinum]|uniref:Uncharacterized protein n=1 Tax=Dactylosporangium cerinum TaxID=1434730 RepID=A0ABV9WKQ4_9ACTN